MANATKRKAAGVEPTLGALISHPTRVKAYVILTERVASPNEIAKATGLEVGHVSYHVGKLAELKVIELVDTAQRRGAVEHYYRAIKRPYASDESFEEMNPAERESLTRFTLQLHLTDMARALDAGTLDGRSNRSLIRVPAMVDEEGFEELAELHDEMYQRKLEIHAKSAERMVNEKTEGIPTVDTSMFFETPQLAL
jgi:DNA-binding transcriptional ArsR family regulator